MLPSSTVLPEGRWNVYAECSDGSRLRAVAGVCDTRQAVGMELGSVTGPVARRLPYETADRFLGVRTWLRHDHAEIDQVQPVEGILHLRGRLAAANGTDFAGDLRLVARSRLDGGPELVMDPVPPSGPGRFDLMLDLDALAAQRVTRHDDWDLYVEGVSSGVRARVARLGDDIADRKSVFHYPFTRCDVETDPLMSEISPAPTVQVRPYITVDSDLSLFVRER